MRVVARLALILHMRGRNRDPPRLLLRRLVNLVIRRVLAPALLRQHLGNRRRQRRLAMINMTNRPNVAVRLRPREFLFGHALLSVKPVRLARSRA